MVKVKGLYKENVDAGNVYRKAQLEGLDAFIKNQRKRTDSKRKSYFKQDFSDITRYEKSIEKYRNDLKKMLGYPLSPSLKDLDIPNAKIVEVAQDDLGYIYRLEIEAMNSLTTYGMLFIPYGECPHPLIIAQHGGMGTPELCSNLNGDSNYNDMTRRILRRGYAVFAPQVLLWDVERYGNEYDRIEYDSKLKQLGSSITAVEIFKIQRGLDYLLSREDIDEHRVGMMGLSYGGFYTLFTVAVETRIKAALSSCFFNNRYKYSWTDWTWFDAASHFLDAEIAAFICPRPLYIEVGRNDQLFEVEGAIKEFERLENIYKRLRISDKVRFSNFDGAHELDVNDVGIEFLCKHV